MKKRIEFELDYEPVIGFAVGVERGYEPKFILLFLCITFSIRLLKPRKNTVK
tara:strand:- start:2882 stop:3037 length:156 start_codon:yes stop_codon:yes gene_type:complete